MSFKVGKIYKSKSEDPVVVLKVLSRIDFGVKRCVVYHTVSKVIYDTWGMSSYSETPTGTYSRLQLRLLGVKLD